MTELLIVGGLTIDRFTDGTSIPGGSVIHAARAASAERASLTILTVAGSEPEAAVGLGHLAEMGDLIHQRAPSTIAYGHSEVDGRRVLTYLAGTGPIATPALTDRPDIALIAPIAHELPASAVHTIRDATRPRLIVLLVQGWLRRLEVGQPVLPLARDEVPAATWEAFGTADAIVVSSEDLAGSPADPLLEVADLRERIGPRPLLVLTLGDQGYLLDDPAADRPVPGLPPRVVRGVPMVGAGDTFGASLAVNLGRGASPQAAAAAAADAVTRMLEGRAA